MKLIFRIAKNEFRYYFYSPVGWFVMIFFLLLNGGAFLLSVYNDTVMQETMMAATSGQWDGFKGNPLTMGKIQISFEFLGGFYYLFIPLITMNLISKEFNSGAIRLINSSPVSTWKFVLGKYLGVVSFLIMILLMFFGIVFAAISRIEHAEYAYFFVAILMFVMLTLIYVAIGMFVSSLTNYAVLSVCITFVVLMGLNHLGTMFQKQDGLRELFYFLSAQGRSSSFLSGLLTSRDIIYHFVVAALFIAFTVFRLNNLFHARSWGRSVLRYAGGLLMAGILITFFSKRGSVWYKDATRLQTNTISKEVQELISRLDGSELKVTLYTNLLGYNARKGIPRQRNEYVWGFWERFFRFYKNVSFDYVHYYDTPVGDSSIFRRYPKKSLKDIATRISEAYDTDFELYAPPEQVKKRMDLSAELKGLLFTMEYKGKSVVVRTFPDRKCWPDDIHLAAALQYLLTESLPRFKFLTGHYERSPFSLGERNYGLIAGNLKGRGSLVNYNLFSDQITEVRPSEFKESDVLVIADPKSELSPEMIDSVKTFIDKGGNAIFYTEPNKEATVNPILNHFGVNVEPGTLVWRNPDGMPDIFDMNHDDSLYRLANEQWLYLYKHKYVDSIPADVQSASVIRQFNHAFKMDSIFFIKNDYYDLWVKKGKVSVDSAAPIFDEKAGDYEMAGNSLIAADFTRTINNREQRLIVMADADYMSNIRFASLEYFGNAFHSYALNNKYPAYHNYDVPKDIFMKGTSRGAGLLAKCLGLYFPAALLVSGTVVLIRRKRK